MTSGPPACRQPPVDVTRLDLLARHGYLGLALGYGGLLPDAMLSYSVHDRVVHHAHAGDPVLGTAVTVTRSLAAGDLDRVCGCFTTMLDATPARAATIDWAHDLLVGDPGAWADVPGRLHQMRYLRAVPAGRGHEDEAFTGRVLATAVALEGALTATTQFQAAARATSARARVAAALTGSGTPWLPERLASLMPAPEPAASSAASTWPELVTGPQMWCHIEASDLLDFGYAYLTAYWPETGVAQAPLELFGLLNPTVGERYLGPVGGGADGTGAEDHDDVAWAASLSATPQEFHEALQALLAARA